MRNSHGPGGLALKKLIAQKMSQTSGVKVVIRCDTYHRRASRGPRWVGVGKRLAGEGGLHLSRILNIIQSYGGEGKGGRVWERGRGTCPSPLTRHEEEKRHLES